ncbi:hypothetical protein [Agrococcus sp. Ld7]|uniref:hypothetical protein n=1 Tax=Agrococcus sp. Ld7 TaxID=649148 RepID=UPI0038685C61
MSQTLITEAPSLAVETPSSVTWTSPSADLWVASSLDAQGVRFLGFVEQSLDGFVAVGGEGAGLGRHETLADAKTAVQAECPEASPVIAR